MYSNYICMYSDNVCICILTIGIDYIYIIMYSVTYIILLYVIQLHVMHFLVFYHFAYFCPIIIYYFIYFFKI